jgi:hypothetical protein
MSVRDEKETYFDTIFLTKNNPIDNPHGIVMADVSLETLYNDTL